MRFTLKIILCSAIPAVLFVLALAGSIGGLVYTKHQFDRYLQTEQRLSNDFTEMYAQGLQIGQAVRNIILDPENKRAVGNFEAARKDYEKAFADAAQVAKGTRFEPAIAELAALRAKQALAQEKILALVAVRSDKTVATLNAEETPAWRDLRGELLKQIASADKAATEARESTYRNADRAIAIAIGLAALAVAVAVGLTLYLRSTLGKELGGDPAEARDVLTRIAEGDLSANLPWSETDTNLMGGLVRMQVSLRRLVGEVGQSTDSITYASGEIAAGSQDLSSRTESQAGALEETAASMEELSSTVRQNADNAGQANALAQSASAVAGQGGQVVEQVVDTMKDILDSSRRIADITGVIDGIAFQTNILALNAAVEAARAGEQGRGFAVVAGEVRTLAQRSAEAAREIKALIAESVGRVEQGSKLVDQAGATMRELTQSVRRVTDIMGEISVASAEQSRGVAQVGEAVTHMDQATQQNAALVEESAAAAMSLREQAQHLKGLVGTFRLP